MPSQPLKLPDFTGGLVILVISALFWAVLPVPRMLCLIFVGRLIWGQSVPADGVLHGLYFVIEGGVALITGMISMFACRILVPGAGRAKTLVLATGLCLLAGAALFVLPRAHSVPAFVSPWDFAVQPPGWLLGYFVTREAPSYREPRLRLPRGVGIAVVLTLVAVLVLPFIFLASESAPPATVNETFQPVPQPPPAVENFQSAPQAPPASETFPPLTPQFTPYVPPTSAPPRSTNLTPLPIPPDAQTTPVQLPSQ